MSQFLATISRLRWIQRWSLKRNTLNENVMEHSWEVAVIAHLLGVINNTVYGGQLNAYRLATLALYHDAAESITGDLPTPVKYYSPEIQKAYKTIEEDAEQALLAMLPKQLQASMTTMIGEPSDWQEGKYLKAADSLSAYLKAKAEVANGNQEYQHTLEDLAHKIASYQLPEVDYFLKELTAEHQASELGASNGYGKRAAQQVYGLIANRT